ncbi:5847_t:CDS:2 [Funneliformis caledonium]|uniref:5847_t:CDS:1 n=1 Tax=Funneliformis caledonium TaxID=1117310 RepID=A0A9N8V1E1_9GLOM|nr:5847_t:CDS:2 [Funneliformis caledonium]
MVRARDRLLKREFRQQTKTQGLIHAWKDGKDGKEDDLSLGQIKSIMTIAC